MEAAYISEISAYQPAKIHVLFIYFHLENEYSGDLEFQILAMNTERTNISEV
jgi:hypothetical protein